MYLRLGFMSSFIASIYGLIVISAGTQNHHLMIERLWYSSFTFTGVHRVSAQSKYLVLLASGADAATVNPKYREVDNSLALAELSALFSVCTWIPSRVGDGTVTEARPQY